MSTRGVDLNEYGERQRLSSFHAHPPPGPVHRLLPPHTVAAGSTSAQSALDSSHAPPYASPDSSSFDLAPQVAATLRNSAALVSRPDPSPISTTSRASPAPSRRSSVYSNVPHFAGSYNLSSTKVASALAPSESNHRAPDDVWHAVCVRVLPLFNGEAHRGYVEDLNELVLSHVQRTFLRQSSRSRVTADAAALVTGLLTADVSDLLAVGFLSLSNKLSPSLSTSALDDDKFLVRLNEVWTLFLTGILPHLEAIFWVLRADSRLKPPVVGSSVSSRPQSDGPIDVRRLALLGFRDTIILPHITRVEPLFRESYLAEARHTSRQPSPLPTSSSTPPFSSASFPSSTPSPSRNPLGFLQPPSLSSNNPTTATPTVPNTTTTTSASVKTSATATTSSSTSSPVPAQTPASPVHSLHPAVHYAATLPASNARRRQMVAILASLLTDDERQFKMDNLLRSMRLTLAQYEQQQQEQQQQQQDAFLLADQSGGIGRPPSTAGTESLNPADSTTAISGPDANYLDGDRTYGHVKLEEDDRGSTTAKVVAAAGIVTDSSGSMTSRGRDDGSSSTTNLGRSRGPASQKLQGTQKPSSVPAPPPPRATHKKKGFFTRLRRPKSPSRHSTD